jgi:uncharacterized membrane protein YqjE
MGQPSSDGAEDAPGLLPGLAALAKNAIALLVNRIELAALELAEIRGSLFRIIAAFAFAILALWFALAWGSVLIAVLAWPTWGWKIVALLAAIFAALAGGACLFVYAALKRGNLSMPATMAELKSDRDALL